MYVGRSVSTNTSEVSVSNFLAILLSLTAAPLKRLRLLFIHSL